MRFPWKKPCPECSRPFATLEGMVIHLVNYHKLSEEETAEAAQKVTG